MGQFAGIDSISRLNLGERPRCTGGTGRR